MFDVIKLIQDNRIKPWHRGDIQDNGTFGLIQQLTHPVPKQDSQHNRPVISRAYTRENTLFASWLFLQEIWLYNFISYR